MCTYINPASRVQFTDKTFRWHNTDEFLPSQIHIHAACVKVAHLLGASDSLTICWETCPNKMSLALARRLYHNFLYFIQLVTSILPIYDSSWYVYDAYFSALKNRLWLNVPLPRCVLLAPWVFLSLLLPPCVWLPLLLPPCDLPLPCDLLPSEPQSVYKSSPHSRYHAGKPSV